MSISIWTNTTRGIARILKRNKPVHTAASKKCFYWNKIWRIDMCWIFLFAMTLNYEISRIVGLLAADRSSNAHRHTRFVTPIVMIIFDKFCRTLKIIAQWSESVAVARKLAHIRSIWRGSYVAYIFVLYTQQQHLIKKQQNIRLQRSPFKQPKSTDSLDHFSAPAHIFLYSCTGLHNLKGINFPDYQIMSTSTTLKRQLDVYCQIIWTRLSHARLWQPEERIDNYATLETWFHARSVLQVYCSHDVAVSDWCWKKKWTRTSCHRCPLNRLGPLSCTWLMIWTDIKVAHSLQSPRFPVHIPHDSIEYYASLPFCTVRQKFVRQLDLLEKASAISCI